MHPVTALSKRIALRSKNTVKILLLQSLSPGRHDRLRKLIIRAEWHPSTPNTANTSRAPRLEHVTALITATFFRSSFPHTAQPNTSNDHRVLCCCRLWRSFNPPAPTAGIHRHEVSGLSGGQACWLPQEREQPRLPAESAQRRHRMSVVLSDVDAYPRGRLNV